MTQNEKGPAATAIAPGHGSTIPTKDMKMNKHINITGNGPLPDGFSPADDVNRAKAIVLTTWLALHSRDLEGGCEGDVEAIADTLYEAYQRLHRAEKNMGSAA